MAWVSRTTREQYKVGKADNATDGLAPGYYEVIEAKKCKANIAPFGTQADRDNCNNAPIAFVNPGPGSYDLSEKVKSPSMRSVFISKSKRTDEADSKKNLPGPGSYNIKANNISSIQACKPKIELKKNQTSINKYVRLPTNPSIPVVSQSFGYDIGPSGQLLINEPYHAGFTGMNNNTVGPGEYNVAITGIQKKPTGAVDFSKSKTARMSYISISDDNNIGPGEYIKTDLYVSKSKGFSIGKKSDNNTDERKNLNKTNNEIPGPGSYDISGDICCKKKDENLQYFGSTSTRFNNDMNNIIPGPGAYDNVDLKSPLDSRYNSYKMFKAPFQTSEERFHRAESVPNDKTDIGPGEYKIVSFTEDLQNKSMGRNNTFGTTEKRFHNLEDASRSGYQDKSTAFIDKLNISDNKNNNNPNDLLKKNKILKKQIPFTSKAERFVKQEKRTFIPSPGDYDVKIKWGDNHGKGILQSTADRFRNDSTSSQIPGPGEYKHINKLDNSKRVYISKEPRFKSNKYEGNNSILGPGRYTGSVIDHQWTRPTFNVTISDEVHKKLPQ